MRPAAASRTSCSPANSPCRPAVAWGRSPCCATTATRASPGASRKPTSSPLPIACAPPIAALVAGSLPFTVGCATKNYVRNEVTPTVNKVNELDDLTAKNTHDIRDTDARAQQGIQQTKSQADAADQKG